MQDLTIVEAMGLANGYEAGSSVQLTPARALAILHEENPSHAMYSRLLETWKDSCDRESITDLLNLVADQFQTGWDYTAVDNYCRAFERGFKARVLCDCIALVVD